MTAPFITIAIQCHNFQRRLCWMLSSLVGQPVVVDVAHMPDNGTPRTEAVVDHFRGLGLAVHSTVFEDYAQFQYRGLTRNAQVQNCATPWICFADTDMVYRGDYWNMIRGDIERGAISMDYPGMYTAGRMSNPPEAADALVASLNGEMHIQHAFARTAVLPLIRRSNVGAGYFQMLRTELCDGYYVPADTCRDHGWTNTYSKCRSDQQFRHRIGAKTRLPRWYTQHAIHLNHARDNEAGHHLEVQR